MYLIALGSNLGGPAGPPAATVTAALDRLAGEGLAVTARSRFWRTPAFPPGAGPDFVNAAAALEAAMPAEGVLAALHRVEASLGRARAERWGPRVCDLDLLGAGDLVLPDRATAVRWMALTDAEKTRLVPPEPILPHPRLHERAFVLVPLAEVAAGWRHPLTGLSVREMLAALPPGARDGIAPVDASGLAFRGAEE